jgi:hypothetical protein
MKNVILAFAAIFAFATTSIAQNAAVPAKTKEPAKRSSTILGLSAEQETRFRVLNNAHAVAIGAVRMDNALTADAKTAKMEALKVKYKADVKSLMNAEQYEKWLALHAKIDARDQKKREQREKRRR